MAAKRKSPQGRAAAATDAAAPARKPLNLALQGGGSHGAFTWGVLDALLEADCFAIEGISGTSAGALNAAVLAQGLTRGGAAGGRAALAAFWRDVADTAGMSPFRPTLLDLWFRLGGIDYSPSRHLLELTRQFASPYQLLPADHNPLRPLLERHVDCAAVQGCAAVKLFICATEVLTCKIRVFRNADVTIDALLASACLPQLFQAVRIGEEYFWDGGFMGNPPIYPLIYHCDSRDVAVVQINPMRIPELPRTAAAIADRINELSFNSSLVREMRAISFVTRLVEQGFDDGGRLKHLLIHTIEAEDEMAKLGAASKSNTDWDFLQHLFALGRARAQAFIADHYDKVGRESSTDIAARFL